MVKQGQYAKASKQKKIRQLKQRHQVHQDRVIATTAVGEFLQVRYHLTQAARQRPATRQTMVRWSAQWLDQAQTVSGSTWSETALTKQTLQAFNRQLPWQGYALIDREFDQWQAFLTKEAPAVPLEERVNLTERLTPAMWQQLLTDQLAVNALLGMARDAKALAQISSEQITALQAGIQTDNVIDWAKVASLLNPAAMATDPLAADELDSKTQAWLTRLNKLTVQDFTVK